MTNQEKDPRDIVLETIAQRIITRIGKRAPYTIQVSSNTRDDADIVIKSGNPVEIYVSNLFLTTATKIQIDDRLERALDKTKDCHKTLSNFQIIGYRESVALLKESKRWIRSANPDAYIEKVSSIFFKKEYTVSVTDALTGLNVSLTGKDVKKLEYEAIRRLIHLVESDQEQEEIRNLVIRSKEKPVTKEEIPEEILLSGVLKRDENTNELITNPNQSVVKMDYVYKEKLVNE